MQLQYQCHLFKIAAIRVFGAPARCPECGDWMVAPISSEFIEGDEIRHHWVCEACGEASSTSINLEPLEVEAAE